MEVHDLGRPSLQSWSSSFEEQAILLSRALSALRYKPRRKGGFYGESPVVDEARSRLAFSASVVPVQPYSLGDTQAFFIEVAPFLLPNAMKFVATFEGWLMWEYQGAQPAVLEVIATDLATAIAEASHNARAPAWILTSWGLTRYRSGSSFGRLRDEAALLEGRFQLARYARVDVSVPGVA